MAQRKGSTAKAEAESATLPAVPRINVECMHPRCPNQNVVVTIDAGIMLADTVMASYSPNCTSCGMPMRIVGPAS